MKKGGTIRKSRALSLGHPFGEGEQLDGKPAARLEPVLLKGWEKGLGDPAARERILGADCGERTATLSAHERGTGAGDSSADGRSGKGKHGGRGASSGRGGCQTLRVQKQQRSAKRFKRSRVMVSEGC